jgi:uncharacterized membrane protein
MATKARILSIDILRGLVMIIMALDHTRDFFHLTAAKTTAALFFTRWITHFCAPVFVFLSGLSAYLSSQNKTVAQSCGTLLKRGIWLVIAEILVITLGLTFNPFYNFIILQVIWVIGFSMILLAVFSRISSWLVLVTGMILVFGHDLLNYADLPSEGTSSIFIKVLFTANGTILPIDATHLMGVFYAILPWTGIMFLGYAAGAWYKKDFPALKRKRYLLLSGLALTVIFIILRAYNHYGDPIPRREYPVLMRNILSFLNTSKYPPSLLYFCMTIGPALILLSVLEKTQNRLSVIISNYGSVPFFYYVIHFYLLHLLLAAAFFLTGHQVSEIVQVPFFFRPQVFGFNLPVVYLIWLFVVTLLYQPCVWFKRYKTNHDQWWLKYI